LSAPLFSAIMIMVLCSFVLLASFRGKFYHLLIKLLNMAILCFHG
jgi:hypothetical protein